MFPIMAFYDIGNHNVRYTKHRAKLGVSIPACFVKAANLFDLLASKFRSAVLFAACNKEIAQANSMMDVFSLRGPFKIFNAIIGLVPVFVISNQAKGAGTDEGLENKNVDKETPFASSRIKGNATVSRFCRGLFQYIALGNFRTCLNLPDLAEVADFINVFIAKHWTPIFHRFLQKANAARLYLSYHNVKCLTAKLQDDRLLNSNILDVVVARLYHAGRDCQAGVVV